MAEIQRLPGALIYVAGPLFSTGEQNFGRYVTESLERQGFDTYWPWRDAGDDVLRRTFPDQPHKVNEGIVQRNLNALRVSSVIVAICDGADVDSGTAMEIGYAHALDKPILCLRTDFRSQGPDVGPVNIMISQVATGFLSSIEDLIGDLLHLIGGQERRIDVQQFYNTIAHEYDRETAHPLTAQFRRAERAFTRDWLGNRRFPVALDVGCGVGPFLMDVTADHKIGIDVSIEMIRRHRRALPEAEYILADCTTVLLPEGSVDVCHCSFLLDHLPDPGRLFRLVSGWLTPQGVFLLSVHTPSNMLRGRGTGPERSVLEYTSFAGRRLQTMSDFFQLKRLEADVKAAFQSYEFSQILVADGEYSVDYYVIR